MVLISWISYSSKQTCQNICRNQVGAGRCHCPALPDV
uniref:Uncharacterized protein n=1 Tax=Rhizophora mucronata TaxID=61149 RepID=A0A2P2NCK5_RHIMU